MECRDNSRAKVAGWTGPTRWLGVLTLLLLIVALPAAAQNLAQDRKAIEKQLREDYKGKLWVLQSSRLPNGLNVKVNRSARRAYESGAPLLLRISGVEVKKNGRIEILARRSFLYETNRRNIRTLPTATGRYTFSSDSQTDPLAGIVALLRAALIPGEAEREKIEKTWLNFRRRMEDRPQASPGKFRSVEITPGIFTPGEGLSPAKCEECPFPTSILESEIINARPSGSISIGVTMWVIVSPEGLVSHLIVVESTGPRMKWKALRAVSRWRYRPAMKDGGPVSVVQKVLFRIMV